MSRRPTWCLVTAAVAVLAASGCSSDSDDLQAARERWEETKPDAFAYTYRVGGQTLTEARVTVDGDRLTFRVLRGGEQLTAEQLSMDAVFGYVAEALREADRVDATYDEDFGYPTRVAVDVATNGDDDEYTFGVKSFTVTQPR